MKKIYFVGAPTKAKGIGDFNYLAEKIKQANFYWFCFKNDNFKQKKYKRINFVVGLNDMDLKIMIKKEMDIMICCSHFEGFCLPIAEALLLKKPVISYRLPEIESVYADNIEYIECFALNEYTKRLNDLVLNDNYSKDKEKARNFIINNYSPRKVAQRLLKILL